MQKNARGGAKPRIVVGDADHRQLTSLAAAMQKRAPEVADELAAEMERAKVVPLAKLPPDVVRMGSKVVYRTDTGERRVLLVYPGDADIAEGRISVMTPIGTALIGLSPGQAIAWAARDGKRHELTIITVEAPDHEPAADRSEAV